MLTAEGDVCPRVAVIPEARALLARLIDAWIPHV